MAVPLVYVLQFVVYNDCQCLHTSLNQLHERTTWTMMRWNIENIHVQPWIQNTLGNKRSFMFSYCCFIFVHVEHVWCVGAFIHVYVYMCLRVRSWPPVVTAHVPCGMWRADSCCRVSMVTQLMSCPWTSPRLRLETLLSLG